MLSSIKPIVKKMPVIKTYVQKLQKEKEKAFALKTENAELKQQIAALKLEMQSSRVETEVLRVKERYLERKDRTLLAQKKPKVSLIVLNRNGKHHLEVLLPSIRKADFYENFEMIVVDNASEDNSVAYLETWQGDLNLTVIQNQENMSFSAANNLAAGAANGEYLLFLNNDTEVTDGWLDELLNVALEKEKVGAVGARLIYPDIPAKEKNAQKSFTIQHGGIGFRDAYRNKTYFVQPYNKENGKGELKTDFAPSECACVTAAVLLVSRDAFEEVGGFDDAYHYGYEDVDLCLKLCKAGYHNYYAPGCMVFHYEFGTQNLDDAREVKERRLHNMHVFQGKWQTWLQRRILNEKLNRTHVFTEQSLLVAFAVNENADEAAKEFAGVLQAEGYEVKYLSSQSDDWYDVGRDTDVLIVRSADYEEDAIKNRKNSLITVKWLPGEEMPWSREKIKDESGTDMGKRWREWIQKQNVQTVNPRKIDLCAPMPDDENKKFWGDYHYALAMKKELEKRGYEVDVRPYQRWYDNTDSAFNIVLRGNRPYYPKEEPKQKNIMWNISHPMDVPMEEYNRYDFVYFASEKLAEQLAGKLKTKCGVLLQCTDPEVMKSDGGSGKKYELLFIGNSRRVYRQVIQDALTLNYKLTIFGRHWDEFPEAQKCVRAAYIPNEQVGQAYRDARIVLNDHWDDMRETGIVSNRLFDALAAEAFVISDEMPEINELFEGTVVTYKDREDLREKVEYYMRHPEEAEKLAARGHELVLKKHTFANRMDTMVQQIERLNGQKTEEKY